MNFNNLKVRQKLWVVLTGVMVLMLVLAFGLIAYLSRIDAQTAQDGQLNTERSTLALRWKAMTEQALERMVIAAISPEPAKSGRVQVQFRNYINAPEARE